MKILHVTEALGGGVQNAISKYTELLPDHQHIVFGRPRSGEASGEYSTQTRVLEYQGSLTSYLLEIRKLVLRERPDVVHIHSSFAGLVRMLAPKSSPLIYSPHCYAFERRDKPRVTRAAIFAVEKVLALRRQALIAVSPHEARLGAKLNSQMPVHYVPNALPSNGGSTVRKETPPSVTMVGRIGPQKDPLMFAEVCELVGQRVNFTWVGDGDPSLKARLSEAGVEVTGWVSPEEARRIVAASHLYLHTGAWEAAPISTIEAATMGTPVIARSIPTMESLGYYTVAEHSEEMAKSVMRFFSSDDFRSYVENTTRRAALRHSVDDARQALADAYASVAHKPVS